MTKEEKYLAILENHLPEQAVHRVYNYLDRNGVHFHITRRRTTKLGDYRWPREGHPYHEISVNGDLDPHLFLWVFLHEAAHLENHLHHPGTLPHGIEWQDEFRNLLGRYIGLFPDDVKPMIHHVVHGMTFNNRMVRKIEDILRHRNQGRDNTLCLDDLPAGSHFRLASHPHRLFVSIKRRRTRWLCRDLDSNREYTVSTTAEVIPETKLDTTPTPTESQEI